MSEVRWLIGRNNRVRGREEKRREEKSGLIINNIIIISISISIIIIISISIITIMAFFFLSPNGCKCKLSVYYWLFSFSIPPCPPLLRVLYNWLISL